MRHILYIILFLLLPLSGKAIDFSATKESVWEKYIDVPPPENITESALLTAIEWQVFGANYPQVSRVSPYGIRWAIWHRKIKRMGLPLVADEYINFLIELKGQLNQESIYNQAQQD